MVLPPVRGAWLRVPAPGAGSQQWERWECPFCFEKHVRVYTQHRRVQVNAAKFCVSKPLRISSQHAHTYLSPLSRLLCDMGAGCEVHLKQKPDDAVLRRQTNPTALCCFLGNTPSGQTAALSSVNNPQCHVALEPTPSQHCRCQRTHHTLTHTHLQEHGHCQGCFAAEYRIWWQQKKVEDVSWWVIV